MWQYFSVDLFIFSLNRIFFKRESNIFLHFLNINIFLRMLKLSIFILPEGFGCPLLQVKLRNA